MRRLVARWFNEDTSVLALTLTALACVPLALRVLVPDAALTLLLPVMLIGVIAGFITYSRPWLMERAPAALIGTGMTLLFLHVGQLGDALLNAVRATCALIVALSLPSQNVVSILPQLSTCWTALYDAWAGLTAFAQRSILWLMGMMGGQQGDDPAARALYLALGVWLLSIWSAWRVRRKDDALGGLLPATAALALTLDITAQNRWPLWVHLSALLLLLGVVNLSRLTRSWRTQRTDYSDSIWEDSFLSGLAISILVIAAGFTISIFSVRDVLDRFRERQQKPGINSVQSSEVEAPVRAGGIRSRATAGLADTHLITAGPELSPDVFMYVRTGDLALMPSAANVRAPRYYWRGSTYQTYTGHGWINPIRADMQVDAGMPLLTSSPQDYRNLHATVSVPGGMRGMVYWAGALVDADMPLDLAWRGGFDTVPSKPPGDMPASVDIIGATVAGDGLEPVQAYSFDSLIPSATEAQLQAAPPGYPEWISQRYTQLPDSVPDRVRALARDITARGRTPYDRAVAIETYLRQIPYSLEVPAPPLGRDATDYFLFELKNGYCDYYATAMAVLARSAGLPARLVTGYATGSYDTYAAEYVVTLADAHSWAEIYFTGIGWIEFEPTASQSAPTREGDRTVSVSTQPEAPKDTKWYILPGVDSPSIRHAGWIIPFSGALYCTSLLLDAIRLRRMNASEATRRVYQRMRRYTGPLRGNSPTDETVREHALAVAARLSAFGRGNRAVTSFAEPVSTAITELSQLYMQVLFAAAPLSNEDGRRATRIWLGLRWRLLLLCFAALLMQHSASRRAVPSNDPKHAAA